MTGASIETTLELWASSSRDVKGRMRGLFTQQRVAGCAGLFLDGLLGEERRKAGWMRAEAAGDPGPWRQQAILGRGRWDADALRDIVRDYVVETLGTEDAVPVIDETGFLKQARRRVTSRGNIPGPRDKITDCDGPISRDQGSWHKKRCARDHGGFSAERSRRRSVYSQYRFSTKSGVSIAKAQDQVMMA